MVGVLRGVFMTGRKLFIALFSGLIVILSVNTSNADYNREDVGERGKNTITLIGGETEQAIAILSFVFYDLRDNNPEAYRALLKSFSKQRNDYKQILRTGLGIELTNALTILDCELGIGDGVYFDEKTGKQLPLFTQVYSCEEARKYMIK